jgi:hypothetical protein
LSEPGGWLDVRAEVCVGRGPAASSSSFRTLASGVVSIAITKDWITIARQERR